MAEAEHERAATVPRIRRHRKGKGDLTPAGEVECRRKYSDNGKVLAFQFDGTSYCFRLAAITVLPEAIAQHDNRTPGDIPGRKRVVVIFFLAEEPAQLSPTADDRKEVLADDPRFQ